MFWEQSETQVCFILFGIHMFVLLFLSNEQLLKALSLVWYLIGNHKKVGHLWDLEGARERLELVRADLLEEGSFDDAVMACEGVFHTASPILTKSESKVC
jgi:hypothetical protein